MTPFDTPFATPFAGALPLLLFLAKATALLAIALIATIPLRRATAGARHLLWLAALVGVIALPLLGHVASLRVGVLPQAFGSTLLGSQTAANPASAANASDASLADLSTVVDAPTTPRANMTVPAARAQRTASRTSTVIPMTPAMPVLAPLQIVALVWAGVALALLGWLVAGALSVRRIARTGRELVSSDWTVPLCEVADRLDLDIVPRLVVSDEIEMAFACRALAPTIVLPAAAETWSDDRRRAVLMHELAHVKRHDLIGHAFGRIACALYWFHPLVWVAAKNLRAESERACDDLVLSCGTRASEYAQHLLDMVTSVRRHGAPVMALPMARKREFEGRMLAILDPAIHRASPGRLQAAAVVATVGVLSLTIAAVAPVTRERAQTAQQPSGETTYVIKTAVAQGAAGQSGVTQQSISQSTSQTISQSTSRVSSQATAQAMSQATAQAISQATSQSTSQSTMDDSVLGASANDVAGALAGASASVAAMANPITSAVKVTVSSVLRSLGDKSAMRTAGADTARVTLLVHILNTDADATVRRTAAWALQDARRADARVALIKALRGDASSSVRETAAWALADYTGNDVVSAIDAGLRDKDDQVRATSAWAAGTIGDASESAALERAAFDSVSRVRQPAIWALGNLDLHTAPPKLAAALSDKSSEVREVAAWTLGQIKDPSVASAIVAAFQTEQSAKVRDAELWALTSMGEASQSVLDVALKSTDPEVRRRAVSLLAGGGEGAWPWPWPWPWPRPFPD